MSASVTINGRIFSKAPCTLVRTRFVPIQATGSHIFVTCIVR